MADQGDDNEVDPDVDGLGDEDEAKLMRGVFEGLTPAEQAYLAAVPKHTGPSFYKVESCPGLANKPTPFKVDAFPGWQFTLRPPRDDLQEVRKISRRHREALVAESELRAILWNNWLFTIIRTYPEPGQPVVPHP